MYVGIFQRVRMCLKVVPKYEFGSKQYEFVSAGGDDHENGDCYVIFYTGIANNGMSSWK